MASTEKTPDLKLICTQNGKDVRYIVSIEKATNE